MREREGEIKIRFDGTLDERSQEDFVEPGAFQDNSGVRFGLQPGTVAKSSGYTTVGTITGAPPCHAIAACGHRDSAAAYFRPKTGQKRIVGTSMMPVRSTVESQDGQNVYMPVQIEQAGPAVPGYTLSAPATVMTPDGRIWHAGIRLNLSMTYSVYVTVREADGTPVVVAEKVLSTSSSSLTVYAWVGLTVHGSTVLLWYRDDTAGYRICARTIAVNGQALTLGTEWVVTTPSSITYITLAPGLVGDDALYAWIAHRHPSNPNGAVLSCVNVTTGAITTQNLTLGVALTTQCCFAVSLVDTGGTKYVPVGIDTGGNYQFYATLNGTTLAVLWTWSTTYTGAWKISVACQVTGTTAADRSAVFAISSFGTNPGANPGAGTNTQTNFFVYALDSFAIRTGYANNFKSWMYPYTSDAGVTWKVSDTEAYPLFMLLRCYGPTSAYGDIGYVEDPAGYVHLALWSSNSFHVNAIARFGVDRITRPNLPVPSSRCLHVANGKLSVAYHVDRGQAFSLGAAGNESRVVVLDLTSPVPAKTDANGTSVISAAQPALWDGDQTVEYGPLHKPKIAASATGGSGAYSMTGSFDFRAVYQWRDSSGNVHRSAPSLPVTISPAGTQPRIWVTRPETLMNGFLQESFEIQLYAAVSGSGLYYLQSYAYTTPDSDGCFYYEKNLNNPVSGDKAVQLYSTGFGSDELLPAAPPPMWDSAAVGNRLWIIDAENRYRALPSKEKEYGIGFEFAPELEILVDGASGKLVAVAELEGDALLFAERGVYRVSGDGPTNTLAGATFSRPRLVSNLGCVDKRSVVRCPAGVLYATTEGNYALIGGGGLQVFDKIKYAQLAGAYVDEARQEVELFTSGSERKLYNYRLGKWARHFKSGGSYTVAAQAQKKALFYLADGTINKLDPATYDSQVRMSFGTGRIIPAGDQGDCGFFEVVFEAAWVSAHGVQINVTTDEGTDVYTWSAAEISALKRAVDSRYTIVATVVKPNSRGIRVSVLETGTSGDAMRPLWLTIPFRAGGGYKRHVLVEGAKK